VAWFGSGLVTFRLGSRSNQASDLSRNEALANFVVKFPEIYRAAKPGKVSRKFYLFCRAATGLEIFAKILFFWVAPQTRGNFRKNF